MRRWMPLRNYFEMFIVFCSVTTKTKGLFIWIYIIGDLNGKMLPLRRKEFSEFLDPAITGQILFFCTRNPDMIVGCLSSSAVFRIGKTLFE